MENPEYTTIKAKIANTVADFVLCWKDGIYKDHRRPETITSGTILDDLRRRDFTINAMAYRCLIQDGKLVISERAFRLF